MRYWSEEYEITHITFITIVVFEEILPIEERYIVSSTNDNARVPNTDRTITRKVFITNYRDKKIKMEDPIEGATPLDTAIMAAEEEMLYSKRKVYASFEQFKKDKEDFLENNSYWIICGSSVWTDFVPTEKLRCRLKLQSHTNVRNSSVVSISYSSIETIFLKTFFFSELKLDTSDSKSECSSLI